MPVARNKPSLSSWGYNFFTLGLAASLVCAACAPQLQIEPPPPIPDDNCSHTVRALWHEMGEGPTGLKDLFEHCEKQLVDLADLEVNDSPVSDKNSIAYYKKNLAGLPDFLAHVRVNEKAFSPVTVTFVRAIDYATTLSSDEAKVAFLHGILSILLPYDTEKSENAYKIPEEKWRDDFRSILHRGKDVCLGFADLLYIGSIGAGIDASKLSVDVLAVAGSSMATLTDKVDGDLYYYCLFPRTYDLHAVLRYSGAQTDYIANNSYDPPTSNDEQALIACFSQNVTMQTIQEFYRGLYDNTTLMPYLPVARSGFDGAKPFPDVAQFLSYAGVKLRIYNPQKARELVVKTRPGASDRDPNPGSLSTDAIWGKDGPSRAQFELICEAFAHRGLTNRETPEKSPFVNVVEASGLGFGSRR